MTTKTLNGKTILVVEVPEDAHNFEVYENNVDGGYCIMFLRGVPDYACQYTGNLPEGQWSILGRAGEIWEEQARGLVSKVYQYENNNGELVRKEFLGFQDYEERFTCPSYKTAIESFQSWLKAEGIKETDLLIIKNS